MADPTYQARILAYSEGKYPLAMQREMAGLLEQAITGASADSLRRKPAPGKWSVAEILAHLADDEVATAWRYRQMLEHNGGPFASFDQDLWARLGGYADWDPRESLTLFRLLRESNLRLLERLTPEQWQAHGVHAERGRITVQELARHMAGHDRNHLDQIRKILGR
ncbi:MAG: DinB family protein [Acidobacteriales bacterium]|nr:DinB family protein [Terriglobales bacterium]